MPSSPIRLPLEDTTNASRTPTPSPPEASAKAGPVLRHKNSQKALHHPHLDSSESYPSPHESIYEASIAPTSAENLGWHDATDWASLTMNANDAPCEPSEDPESWAANDRPSWENTVLDASGNAVPLSFITPKKHKPHILYPITEQNSLATLRTGASFSTLKAHSSVASIRPISPGLNGKKRKSFSTADLPPNPSPLPTTRTLSPPPSPQSFYTPMEPHRPPPVRTPTPPGLPTFNAPEASNYRLPPPTIRLRDKLRSPTAAEREWVMQTVGLPKGVVMRGEDGVLVRGKFTPIRSGHFPPQKRAHALFQMPDRIYENPRVPVPARPVALDQRHVQFTGPRTEPVGTTGEGNVEPTVMSGGLGMKRNDERAEKVLRGLSWVVGCCGVCEAGGKSLRRRSGSVEGMPLFVGGFETVGQQNAREAQAL